MTDLTIHDDPAVSEAQRRAMWAAAKGHSTLGIPKEVGKEFVKADSEIRAAGICYVAGDSILLLQRGEGGDYPLHWAFPGGHLEAGESAEQAAIREFAEETGRTIKAAKPMGVLNGFAAFITRGEPFDFALSPESVNGLWWTVGAPLPDPMHPDCLRLLREYAWAGSGMNELAIARGMSSGVIDSPQHYGNVWLFDIRITGTGVAYRSANKEFAWRNPGDYLNQDFLNRCNGLPVILEHPDKGILNSEEFQKRTIGTVLLPYIKGDEVWGIAKIYDAGAAELMQSEQLSTSPSVVTKGDAKLVLSDGSECTVEGQPTLVDHIAICEVGVWDKGGPAVGVNSNHAGASIMNEDDIKAKADAEAAEKKEMQEKIDSLMAKCDELQKKVDTMPTEMMADKAKKDEAEAKAKADAEAAEKKAAEEEKAKADSALRAEIEALKAQLPRALTDEDMNALADAQAKADSVFAAFGESAPRPLTGETPLAYRRRLAAKLKAHSKDYAEVDLAKADGALFDIAEKAIYADAFAVAASPASAAAGGLRPVTRRTTSGHTVTEWKGDPESYMGGFAAKPSRVVGFNTKH